MTDAAEIAELIATRNRPLLTALEICADQLRAMGANDAAVSDALRCAERAIAMERGFQRDMLQLAGRA